MCRNRIGLPLSFVVCLFVAILSGCGSSGSSSSTSASTASQFTHVYVVSPPAASSGVNYTHFMSTVMSQGAIEGVTVDTPWDQAETGTPGLGTCSPTGTDTCQIDSAGYTHTYNWGTIDSGNAPWFATSKKVNIILDGIGGAGSNCLILNDCINSITPYYVTTSTWAADTGATSQDVINASQDACTNYLGLIATSMTRDPTGLVTVTEANSGYIDGQLIWVGGSSPSNYNIAQEAVTSVQVASGVLTITAANSLPVGAQVVFQGLGNATFLNGQAPVTITSASATQFTATTTAANYGPTAETAGTANPLGVPVQNATSASFQYQTAIPTNDSATSPGTVISAQQSWPVPYETPYKTAWEAFIAAAVIHFNGSLNLSQISYMRVGRSAGGEAFPYCTANLEQLPSPNTYTKSGWLQYYTDIDDFVAAQGPTMQIIDPINQEGSGASADVTYADSEASTAVSIKNAAGATNGIGSQGLQASDITNYGSGSPCTSDWCNLFSMYQQTGIPLELQTDSLSAPVAIAGTISATGDLRPLLPFAVQRYMSILELYNLDALLAYDPNYCVLTVPDSGVCTTGSVEIPVTTLPAGDQYQYFQAVGQPGQTGATGNGSYATVINQTEGQH